MITKDLTVNGLRKQTTRWKKKHEIGGVFLIKSNASNTHMFRQNRLTATT